MNMTVPTWAKIAAFALVFGLAFWSVATDDDPAPVNGESDSGLDEGSAWHACKEAVKAHLTNPATADFSLLSTSITESGDGFDIDGSLTAKNSFGVESDIAFSCDVASDGTAFATVTD